MKRTLNYAFLATWIFVLASCNEDEVLSNWVKKNPETNTTPTGEAGELDLSNYVAIGNSLTAGYMDGALYNDGQSASYANMVAKQMQITGAGDFNQPDINSVYGFNQIFSNPGKGIIAGRSFLDLSIPGPNAGANGEMISAFSGDKAKLNNFGVPGMTIKQTEMPGYGHPTLGNSYYSRFASNPNTSSVLGDVLAADPSFFSLWVGANDYLGYAIQGGSPEDEPLAVLSASEFGDALNSILRQLTADDRKGVIIDLPPVVTLPLFQAVPYNAIPLDATTVTLLNLGLARVNDAIRGAVLVGYTGGDIDGRLMSYAEGSNPILVIDTELDDLGPYFDKLGLTPEDRAKLVPYEQSRPLVAGELVLLSAVPKLGTNAVKGDNSTPIGLVVPLGFDVSRGTFEEGDGDKYFLNVREQKTIVTARATYNSVIHRTVKAMNAGGADIALVSVQPTFVDFLGLDMEKAAALALPTDNTDKKVGLVVNGVTLTPDFSPSGLMSTDAVHPNPRGHAVIANLIIDAINKRWGASIPKVDVLAQRGVYFSSN